MECHLHPGHVISSGSLTVVSISSLVTTDHTALTVAALDPLTSTKLLEGFGLGTGHQIGGGILNDQVNESLENHSANSLA